MVTTETFKKEISLKDYILFLAAFILFFLILVFRLPTMSYLAEMFAEMGSNYFYHAQYSDFSTNIMATDYGYLPFLTRIFSLSASWLGVPVAMIPFYYGYIGLATVAVFCASICLPQFRTFVKSDALRFLTGLAFALYRNYELNTFINCLYFGAIPYFLIIERVPYTKASKSCLLLMGIFLLLMGLSKPLFITFSIPILVLIIWSIHHKKWELLLVLIPALIAFAIQFFVLRLSSAQDIGNVQTTSGNFSTVYLFYFSNIFHFSRLRCHLRHFTFIIL